MSDSIVMLPHGFGVRVHDDVDIGEVLVTDHRVVRLSATAQHLLRDRVLTVRSRTTALLAGRLLDLDLADPDLTGVPGPGLDDLTVVVPVRDAAPGVERLLRQLASRVRCVVVDDASSSPGELEKIVLDHGVRLLRLEANVGPAAARDAGLREVGTPFVAFVDADVEASPDSLLRLLRHLVDPGLAAVAPRVRSVGGGSWIERYEQTQGSLDLGPTSATVRKWTRVAYVPSACLVARVDALGSGFDPTLRSGEDVDLVWRLETEGRRVRYAADVVVHHETRTNLAAWLRRKAFYGTSAGPLARRHGDRMAPAVLTPRAGAAIALVLLHHRWTLSTGAALAVADVRRAGSSVSGTTPQQRQRLSRAHMQSLVSQTSGLVLRHWSPATVALCLVSTRARRATAVLAVADAVLAHRSSRTDLDLPRFAVLRRSEHLAYGLGVWWGAARERSVACLVPRWLSPTRSRS